MKPIVPQPCSQCAVFNRSAFYKSEVAEDVLADHKKTFVVKKGEYLFKEGTNADGVFCVKSGKVFIYKKDGKGEQHVLTDAAAGELLGIAAVTDSIPYGTSARAASESEVCFIPKEIFTQLVALCPHVSTESLKMLSGKLNKLDHI